MPWLAALVACSAFDLALHDAYGNLVGLPTYETYDARFMNADLASYLEPADGSGLSFEGKYPSDYLTFPRPDELPAWHLVGGKDPIDPSELTGLEPKDGYPVLLRDWIKTDGLNCLKAKLRGDDPEWDFDRLSKVGRIAEEERVDWLSARLQLHRDRPGLRRGDPRPPRARTASGLRDASLRRTTVPLRPGSLSDRRPERLRT